MQVKENKRKKKEKKKNNRNPLDTCGLGAK